MPTLVTGEKFAPLAMRLLHYLISAVTYRTLYFSMLQKLNVGLYAVINLFLFIAFLFILFMLARG